MKYFKSRKDSLELWLSFFMILGAAAGSVFCNRMDGQMKEELRAAESGMITASMLLKLDFMGLFFAVLRKRLGELFFLFLVAMTQAAPLFFLGISGYLGFSVSVMVCALTMDGGLLGIVRYLALAFPQMFFYGAVFYVTVWWMPVKKKRLTLPAAALLTAVVILGAAAESFVNPWIAAWFLGK